MNIPEISRYDAEKVSRRRGLARISTDIWWHPASNKRLSAASDEAPSPMACGALVDEACSGVAACSSARVSGISQSSMPSIYSVASNVSDCGTDALSPTPSWLDLYIATPPMGSPLLPGILRLSPPCPKLTRPQNYLLPENSVAADKDADLGLQITTGSLEEKAPLEHIDRPISQDANRVWIVDDGSTSEQRHKLAHALIQPESADYRQISSSYFSDDSFPDPFQYDDGSSFVSRVTVEEPQPSDTQAQPENTDDFYTNTTLEDFIQQLVTAHDCRDVASICFPESFYHWLTALTQSDANAKPETHWQKNLLLVSPHSCIYTFDAESRFTLNKDGYRKLLFNQSQSRSDYEGNLTSLDVQETLDAAEATLDKFAIPVLVYIDQLDDLLGRDSQTGDMLRRWLESGAGRSAVLAVQVSDMHLIQSAQLSAYFPTIVYADAQHAVAE